MSIFSAPSNAKIFMQNVAHYVPMGLQEYLYDNLPGKGLDKARANRVAAHKVANQLLEEKNEELATGKAARDVMSILSMFLRALEPSRTTHRFSSGSPGELA